MPCPLKNPASGTPNVRGNMWYDAMGRVWQRWNDDSVSEEWAETLMRYVYDGSSLAQEHQFLASGNGMWIYNYVRYDRDYLHKPDGVRQRSYVGPSSYTDDFLFRDMADISAKVVRGSSVTVTRAPRMASGERQPENDLAPTTSSFTDISRLGAHGAFTECYGGGTTNPRTAGFDALLLTGGRHYLAGLGSFNSRRGNCPYCGSTGGVSTSQGLEGGRSVFGRQREGVSVEPFDPPHYGEVKHAPHDLPEFDCPDCCWEYWFQNPPLESYSDFCWNCCGTRAGYDLFPCPELKQEYPDIETIVVSGAWCRLRCCPELRRKDNPEFEEQVLKAMFQTEGCYNVTEDIVKAALTELAKTWNTATWYWQLYNCIQDALNNHDIEGLLKCIQDALQGPSADDPEFVAFLRWLVTQMPDFFSGPCCDGIMSSLFPQGDRNPLCCRYAFANYMNRAGNFDRFLIQMQCCYGCPTQDPRASSRGWEPFDWGIPED